MKAVRNLIHLFTSLAFLSLLAIPDITTAHSTQTVTIELSDTGANPAAITIKQGDSVEFINKGTKDHWPASNIHPTHRVYPNTDIRDCGTSTAKDMFDACHGLKPGESYTFRFEYEGEWKFHDHLNPTTVGTITVGKDLDFVSSQPQQAAPKPQKELFTNIIGAIQNFFSRIIAFFGGAKKTSNTVIAHAYDSTIAENSEKVFTEENALYSYVKKFGPAKTTAYLARMSSTYGDCHQSAHKAGRAAYEIFGDKAFQQCGSECHSGCYHGATEAYFREHGTANLAKILKTICSSELNPFFSHQCIHGIGHGLMAWSNYEINDALEHCDLLPSLRDSCYTGVFMENIVGGLANTEDHQTKYLNGDPQYPCTMVKDQYKGSCYFYQTSYMLRLFNGDFKKVAQACSKAPDMYHIFCFQSMGRDVGEVYATDVSGAIKTCSYANLSDDRNDCLVGAVQNYFWDPSGQDDALLFCKTLTEATEKQSCYSVIFERAINIIQSKSDREKFCAKVEPRYQDACKGNM